MPANNMRAFNIIEKQYILTLFIDFAKMDN